MEECYFSIKVLGVYLKLTKNKEFKIVYLNKEKQWAEFILFR